MIYSASHSDGIAWHQTDIRLTAREVQVSALLVLWICETSKKNLLFRGLREDKVKQPIRGERKRNKVAIGTEEWAANDRWLTGCSVITFRVDCSWNVMAHGDTREGKWRVNWWMEWVASTFHTTSQHGVSSITTADAHTSAASSRLNWSSRRFKRTRPFRRKTKSDFCECAITFQLTCTTGKGHNLPPVQWVRGLCRG